MIQKLPGLIDRAATITVLSPPIHDYVMMSHAGAPPVAPVGPSSPATWRAFLVQVGLPWQAIFSSAYSSSLAAHLWLLNSIPRVNSCPTSNPRSPQGQMRTGSANYRQPTDVSPQITTVHLFLAGGIVPPRTAAIPWVGPPYIAFPWLLWRGAHTQPASPFRCYPNLVQDLAMTRPDQVWVADITYTRLKCVQFMGALQPH
jgi:hypothetical protein